jgi:hypothetical protein
MCKRKQGHAETVYSSKDYNHTGLVLVTATSGYEQNS